MDKFVGKWEVVSTENMENMLKAFDMPDEKIKMFAAMKFVMEYKRDGDTWTYDVSTPNGHKVKTFQFKLGDSFDSTTFDGRPIKIRAEFSDGQMLETHTDVADSTLNSQVSREIINDELIVKATVRGVTGITKHKRV